MIRYSRRYIDVYTGAVEDAHPVSTRYSFRQFFWRRAAAPPRLVEMISMVLAKHMGPAIITNGLG
jgi:hypothetical protein